MKKDEKVLIQHLAMLDLYGDINKSKTLSAMEQQAVDFAEWRENQNCSCNQETGLWYIFGIDGQCFTTSELYQLFNQQN